MARKVRSVGLKIKRYGQVEAAPSSQYQDVICPHFMPSAFTKYRILTHFDTGGSNTSPCPVFRNARFKIVPDIKTKRMSDVGVST